MAEGLLRAQLSAAGLQAKVGSAGLLPGGSPATAHAVKIMAQRGIDISQHVSYQLTTDVARSANLLVGMARQHVREACVGHGALFQRAFTLKELVRLGEGAPARQDSETLYSWLARIGRGRKPSDIMGDADYDDIADPVGKPMTYYERTADELEGLLGRLVHMVAGAERHSGAGLYRL